MSDLIDDLIEAARLLGATQAKKGIGCYTREDARFERAMHESISDKAKRLTAERDDLKRAVRYEADCVEAAKAEIERLTAALQYEQHRAGRQGTHGDGCADWGPEHYECAIRERDELRRQLAEAEMDAERYR